LKSGNILVKRVKGKELETPYIHAKVADFGLSKTKDSTVGLSKLGENTGTDRWMPPEVIKLSPSRQRAPFENNHQPSYPFKCNTFKCDTYSFAMVCYEILTGYLPFEKESYNGSRLIKEKILEGIRPKLSEDPKQCPPMLKALIERCWSQDPRERPRFDFICSHLRFLKYLLMTGTSLNPTELYIFF
jgi:serine/threonine protein kinase